MNNYSAFPVIAPEHGPIMTGLSKRELFAAMAMQGLLANPNWDYEKQYAAEYAVHEADKLLNALES